MANASIAALRLTRNDVENLISIFRCLLEYVQNEAISNDSDIQQRKSCLAAIETLLSLGYQAISQHGLYVKAYQKHFQKFLFLSSSKKSSYCPYSWKAENSSIKLAQSLVDIFLLAINVFTKLNYPNYYENFMCGVKVLFESKVVQKAGLCAIAARLTQIFFISKGEQPLQLQITDEPPQSLLNNSKKITVLPTTGG